MRAFLNGRLDLTQAEAVVKLSIHRLYFKPKSRHNNWRDPCPIAAEADQARVDRPDRCARGWHRFRRRRHFGCPRRNDSKSHRRGQSAARKLAATFTYGKLVHEGLTLAIVGRPNVGKSSLFNRLVERERAIVTAQPGTTRDLVSETVAIGGIPVELVDTAGIRNALDEAESIGIKKSMEALADADLVLVVIDKTQRDRRRQELLSQVEGRARRSSWKISPI